MVVLTTFNRVSPPKRIVTYFVTHIAGMDFYPKNDFYIIFNCTYMHSRHAEAIFEIYIMAVVLKIQKYVCVHNINIGCNGTENNRTVSRACEPCTHC